MDLKKKKIKLCSKLKSNLLNTLRWCECIYTHTFIGNYIFLFIFS